jgi:beta-lactamase superfamily II metal-dependent hydrolase
MVKKEKQPLGIRVLQVEHKGSKSIDKAIAALSILIKKV